MSGQMSGPMIDSQGCRLLARLQVPGRPESLRLIRALVREVATAHGPHADWAHDLVLAVDEACQNVVRHGYRGGTLAGDITVEVRKVSEGEPKDGAEPGLFVRIHDTAPPVDPARLVPRALDDVRPGGLGVHFMRTLTDECCWQAEPDGGGNAVILRKNFKTTGEAEQR